MPARATREAPGERKRRKTITTTTGKLKSLYGLKNASKKDTQKMQKSVDFKENFLYFLFEDIFIDRKEKADCAGPTMA